MIGAMIKAMFGIGGGRAAGAIADYERAFAAAVLGDPAVPCLAFWKGRVALWTILRALGVQDGLEVVVPAYTCEMVPLAVKFAGGRCRFVDLADNSFNTLPAALAEAVTPATRAVIVQHTYGVRQSVAGLKPRLEAGPAIVEDCCHLIDSRLAPHDLRPAARLFSMQWNKPYSTGLGGMAAVFDAHLLESCRRLRDHFDRRGERQRNRSLAIQLLLHRLTSAPAFRRMAVGAYRQGQRLGLINGTSAADEMRGEMPANYLARAVATQAAAGLQQLRRWPANVEHRRKLTDIYRTGLREAGIDISSLGSEPLWAVPVLVENKNELLHLAKRNRLAIATWFGRTPLHVTPGFADQLGYRIGSCPNSERRFATEVHLITAPWVSERGASGAVRMLTQRGRFI